MAWQGQPAPKRNEIQTRGEARAESSLKLRPRLNALATPSVSNTGERRVISLFPSVREFLRLSLSAAEALPASSWNGGEATEERLGDGAG